MARLPLTSIALALTTTLAAQTRVEIKPISSTQDPKPTRQSPQLKPDIAPVSADPREFVLNEKLGDEPDFAPMTDVLDKDGNVIATRPVGDPYVLSFTNGNYTPPKGIDPELRKTLQMKGHTYGFVMIQGRMAEDKMKQLRDAGLELLGVHTYQSVKAKIPATALGTLQTLPFVRWVGYARESQKVNHYLAPELDKAQEGDSLQITVTPFEDDICAATRRVTVGERSTSRGVVDGEEATSTFIIPNGKFHRRLLAMGFAFEHYNEITHSFRGHMPKSAIVKLLKEDWVHTVEPAPGKAVAEHDQAMPMIRQDWVRKSYSGKGVAAGYIDSGIDASPWHKDFWGMYYVSFGSATTPLNKSNGNPDGHGTHVAGTILGTGLADKRYMGAAPGTGHGGATNRFFLAKFNASDSTTISNFGKNYTDGNNNVSPYPRVISCSYSRGTPKDGYYGTDDTSRAFDDATYNKRQLYVFAAGNKKSTEDWWGSRPGVAKNVLTVGGVIDKYNSSLTTNPGQKYGSGRWGVRDFRTKPEVCAIADKLTSCLIDTTDKYSNGSGTSMATPMVSGALISRVNASSWYKDKPEALKARAVASAKHGNASTSGSWAPPESGAVSRQTMGWGMIDSAAMSFSTSDTSSYTWGGTFTTNGQTWSTTFTMPSDAQKCRMVLCFTEKSSSSGATKARVNDVRAHIDFQPYKSGNTSGDYSAWSSYQTVMVANNIPVPAAAKGKSVKIKMEARSLPSPNARWCVVVLVYKKSTTTNPTVSASGSTYVKPNEAYTLTGQMKSPATQDAFRSGRLWYDGNFAINGFQRTTIDSIVHAYTSGNPHTGDFPIVGKGKGSGMVVGSGTSRTLSFALKASASNGWHNLYVRGTKGTTGASGTQLSALKSVCVDGLSPALITGVTSTSHTAGGWTNKDDLSVKWNTPTDIGCSGIHGLAYHVDKSISTNPAVIDALGAKTSTTFANLGDTTLGYYFHVRPRDKSGNYGTTRHIGPFKIDTINPKLTWVQLGSSDYTNTLNVKVKVVTASDERSGLYQIRYYAGSWGSWMSYSTERVVNLTTIGASTTGGLKKVWVQVKDRAGNVSSLASDTITYIPVPQITSMSSTTFNVTKGYIVLNGSGFSNVTRAWFGPYFIIRKWDASQEDYWYTGRFRIISDTQMRVYPPQNRLPGDYDIWVQTINGSSNKKTVKVIPWTLTDNLMQTETAVTAGKSQHIIVALGKNPADTTQITMLSPELKPSTLPGVVSMGIGNNWTNYYLLPKLTYSGSTKNSVFSGKVPLFAKGFSVYFQTAVLHPTKLPLLASSTRKVTYK